MSRIPWGRILFILVILAVSALVIFSKPIMFGLDLQGGSHLLIRVHVDEAVESEVDNTFAAARNALQDAGIEISTARESVAFMPEGDRTAFPPGMPFFKILDDPEGNPPHLEFDLADAERMDDARQAIRERINVEGDWSMTSPASGTIRLTLSMGAITDIRRSTVQNVRRSISYRIDQLGVAEPNIVIQGDQATSQRILLQLPGIEDPEEAKDRIRTPGNLEFRMLVYDEADRPYQALTREALLENLGGDVLAGQEIVPEYAQTLAEARGQERLPLEFHLLYKEATVNSNYLIDARASRGQQNRIVVQFTFDAEGGQRFRQLTAANIGKLMAVVLDDEAIEVAVINDEIGSVGEISGQFTREEADRLAWLLRSGAVPTSMHFEEERSVGPALGADSIRFGTTAALWGMAIVVVFMVLYYRLSGFVAVLALAMNILLIMAFLAWFGAVLTLPGIGGIILTIGMAVDANVLIFERIREELRVGKTVMSSIESGFGKAFGTIFDANVTTFIAAIFLFQFGTGPIRGFATTITIGLAASMFTAVFVARVVFDSVLAIKRNQIQKLSI